jgi:hypothetical protein
MAASPSLDAERGKQEKCKRLKIGEDYESNAQIETVTPQDTAMVSVAVQEILASDKRLKGVAQVGSTTSEVSSSISSSPV